VDNAAMSGAAPPLILTVNAGSSSIRLALFASERGGGVARVRSMHEDTGGREAGAAAATILRFLDGAVPAVVAHRVVHGGPRLLATCRLDEATRAEIARMIPLAPLHNPAALTWAEAARQALPAATALAVFDTGFFAGLPAVAATYALPRDLRERWGLRRLGFHGLAHRSMWEAFRATGARPAARVISFQLGSGCSVAALREGVAVDTSMGFTPQEGLVMATRAGDIDPGMLLFLIEYGGVTAAELDRILSTRSGLAALGGGRDLRALLKAEDAEARLAVDVYCYRARKYLGAYLAVLGGCDAVLIGGGAGEHAPELRRRLMVGLEALGIELDDSANARVRAPGAISAPGSGVAVWVIPTDEEVVLAREALAWEQSG
jgi:acetate kinase